MHLRTHSGSHTNFLQTRIMNKVIFCLFTILSFGDAKLYGRHAGWGRFPVPTQLGLTELVGRLQADSTTNTTALSLTDQINALISSASGKVAQSQALVTAQLNELTVAGQTVNRTVAQVATNEAARISIIKEYNKDAMVLNQLLVEMTTGAQQVNDVIGVANRVKKNLAADIRRVNEAIAVTNDWMVKMDSWVSFVTDETAQIDQAQANLLAWGDATRENVNLHEVAAQKLGREAYDLETQIIEVSNLLLSTGAMMGYTPSTLTIAEASGGLGWDYTYWS